MPQKELNTLPCKNAKIVTAAKTKAGLLFSNILWSISHMKRGAKQCNYTE